MPVEQAASTKEASAVVRMPNEGAAGQRSDAGWQNDGGDCSQGGKANLRADYGLKSVA